MAEIPHLALPFRVERGRAAVVEQDSDEDVEQCVEAVLRYRPGERPEAPDFGTPDQTHRQGGADLQELADAVSRWEPRAHAVARDAGTDELGMAQRVQIAIDREGASGGRAG